MSYLTIFYPVSAGQNGPLLGADEEEIVLLHFIVLEPDTCQEKNPRPENLARSKNPGGTSVVLKLLNNAKEFWERNAGPLTFLKSGDTVFINSKTMLSFAVLIHLIAELLEW
ncbi:unnamed protein product [Notodromas monacha]|uniref:Uncharacterized protein n=1 Tax=Notodromas monacha TaxID=399045 RepID=A0A7R9G957_9CRUS|nr:unnamed protein product [Notodromas monacha]CAG0912499.1 unnamed protein product [Notodromas monacha]